MLTFLELILFVTSLIYKWYMTYRLKIQLSRITTALIYRQYQYSNLSGSWPCWFVLIYFLGEFIYLERPQQEVFKNNSEHGYQGLYTCLRCLTILFQLFCEIQWTFLAKFQLWQALFQPGRLTHTCNFFVAMSLQNKSWQW